MADILSTYLNGLHFQNPSTYEVGWQSNDLSNKIYYHAGDYANAVQDDAAKIWEREDTAYQRMVADMKAAGLNPWLGVSSGGSPTSDVNPSLEGLTSLLGVLSGTLENERTFTQSSKRLFDSVIGALSLLIPF